MQYDWNKDLTIGIAYKYIDLGDARMESSGTLAGVLNGKFETYNLHVLMFNMAWKF